MLESFCTEVVDDGTVAMSSWKPAPAAFCVRIGRVEIGRLRRLQTGLKIIGRLRVYHGRRRLIRPEPMVGRIVPALAVSRSIAKVRRRLHLETRYAIIERQQEGRLRRRPTSLKTSGSFVSVPRTPTIDSS